MERYKLGMAAIAGLVLGMACKEQIEDGVATVLDTATTPASAAEPVDCSRWRIQKFECPYLDCEVDGEPFSIGTLQEVVTRVCLD
jgi:hypothetical protein